MPVERACFLVLSLAQPLARAAEVSYTVTDLGQINPTAINDAGQVTGHADFAGQTHAFLYNGSITLDLAWW
ncbi:MAG: hypothetical protein ACREXU_16905 [Gammaproteobacteria bacterium]